MTALIAATEVVIHDEENHFLVGFADDADAPREYLMLQCAHEFDEQDTKLGMNTSTSSATKRSGRSTAASPASPCPVTACWSTSTARPRPDWAATIGLKFGSTWMRIG